MANKSNSQLLHLGHKAVLDSESRLIEGGLTQDPAYAKLRKYHSENAANLSMVDMFTKEPNRFDKFK